MEATSKWHKFLRLPKWSPEIVPAGLPKLWMTITPDWRVRSQRGLNQSCNPCRDLSNAMSHSQIGCWQEVYSWLLVFGSQIVNLTSGPSFAHNLGCRCPNGSYKAILDIYISRTFQWHQEHLNTRFDPCNRVLSFRESRKIPTSHFWECEFHPHTYPKVGSRHFLCLIVFVYVYLCLFMFCIFYF